MVTVENRFCDECGAVIDVDYTADTKIVIEHGKVFPVKYQPQLTFKCSVDSDHELEFTNDFNAWAYRIKDALLEQGFSFMG